MDNFFHQTRARQRTADERPFCAVLQVFDRILKRLAGLIRLTEEEQKDAGIYLGDQRYK